jgi:hypothetical protein
LKVIAEKGRTDYASIMLYNFIREDGSAANGIEALSCIHSNLMGLHGFMAGFQYVVLEGTVPETGLEFEVSTLQQTTFTLRFLGFLCSLAGTIISLITME